MTQPMPVLCKEGLIPQSLQFQTQVTARIGVRVY